LVAEAEQIEHEHDSATSESALKVDRNYLFSILEPSRVDRLRVPERATEHRISARLAQQVAAQAVAEQAMVRRILSGLVLA
jgi:hypothetical protein